MRKKSLIWKIPCAALGVVIGLIVLLLIAVTVVLATPGIRSAALQKCMVVVGERTGMDVDLGRIYLSPFHHSPKILYQAYKGRGDLPVRIEIDSLFIGHRNLDTLLYVHALHLQGCMMEDSLASLTGRDIIVDSLLLDGVTAHTDTLIKSIGLDIVLDRLQVKSPGINIDKGKYPLHGLRLSDVFVGVDLRGSSSDEPKDTTSTPMAFDLPDALISNVRFLLSPLGLLVSADSLSTSVLADVGGNLYHARALCVRNISLKLNSLNLPFEAIDADARVDLDSNLIQSGMLRAGSDAFGAKAHLENTRLDLETMRVDLAGEADFMGSTANLKGFYDIDDEAYDMLVNVLNVDVGPFLGGSHKVSLTGDVHAQGQGIDIHSPDIKSKVAVRLADCRYDNIDASGIELDATLEGRKVDGNLILPLSMTGDSLRVRAKTKHRFSVTDFLTPRQIGVDYHSQINNLYAHAAGEDWNIDCLNLDFSTDTNTSLRAKTRGLSLDVQSPMHILCLTDKVQPLLGLVKDSSFVSGVTSLKDLTMLDTLRRRIPELSADFKLTKGSPVHPVIQRKGLDLNELSLSLESSPLSSDLALQASVPAVDNTADSAAMRLPAARASMRINMTEGSTAASLKANTNITDGVLNLDNLAGDAALNLQVQRVGRQLNGKGHLSLDSLRFNDMSLGNRTADILIAPSQQYSNSLRADVRLDDIPTELVNGILGRDDIDLGGFIQAKAAADGLPSHMDVSAQVLPREVSVLYKPYDVKLSLGETPIVMTHNNVEINDLRIFGADSTYLSVNGGMNLDTKKLDINLSANNFSPTELPKDGPIPVYGTLATDISGRVTGQLDNILANIDVTVLPSTDITYPIDKKNLAQVKPSGTVNVKYGTADAQLNLGGRINVDDGLVRYSPAIYPMMPFKVDPGSHVSFDGPLGRTMIDVSASQQVKADVESEGEETRRVTFNTGVRVKGELDSLGLGAIGFFLEAPDDEVVTREIASMDQETKEGVAAALLATGMYMGESNVAAKRQGYALSSIINSRLNAAMANSKVGNIVDIDISRGQTEHASGRSNDTNIAISKSLFHDKLRITLGSVISDNPEVMKANGLLNQISADYKLTKSGNVLLRVFSRRDYDNIFEGELVKSGLGVVATTQWDGKLRTYKLTSDADIAYRSNNSIGPTLTLTHSIRNLLGHGETFSVKGHGAYYWSLRDRSGEAPGRTDTYKGGLDAALVFPYLHWPGDNHPDGDTRYRVGYKYENIAGGYGVHKFSGAFSYLIRPSGYLTHMITPLSLSLVRSKISDNLLKEVANNPEVLKLMAGNELVPSVGYGITYNDYRARKGVNTMIDFEIKEAGNLTNAVFCAFGNKWDQKGKAFGGIPFNQFVKFTVELWNKFNFTDRVCFATRLYAGTNVPVGNSDSTPLSEAFYAGGTNSMRAAVQYAHGPGNFHSTKFRQNYFHAGDVRLEANAELRFPLVWKINGAVFLDAGNVWNWTNTMDYLSQDDYEAFAKLMGLTEKLYDGIIGNPYFASQIALGTGAGIRLDLDGLVIRLDLGYCIHAPYQTYRYDKQLNPDYTRPINTYYNMPSVLDALRLNFGIGYPF